MNRLQRIRRESRQILELFLIPGLAAILPWRWAFSLFRRICVSTTLYGDDTALALAHATATVSIQDAERWILERRLTTLVDHADCYLSLTRRKSWMRKHLRVDGAWPMPGQEALLLTFHWSAGMWGLRHARATGLSPHMLLATGPAQRTVADYYARLRTYAVRRATGNAAVPVPVRTAHDGQRAPFNFQRMRQVYQDHEQLLAVIDVPPDQVGESIPVTVLGRGARAPVRLLRDAVQRKIPVYVYRTGLDIRTGQRHLHIRQMTRNDDAEQLATQVFRELETTLRQSSAAWHFWAIAPRFFVEPPV